MEHAIKDYWELKGGVVDSRLVSRGDSTKMLTKVVQVQSGESWEDDAEVAAQTDPRMSSLQHLGSPFNVGELFNDGVKNSSVEGLHQLSLHLCTARRNLETAKSVPALAYIRSYALNNLLIRLASAQQSVRSSLRSRVLERWAQIFATNCNTLTLVVRIRVGARCGAFICQYSCLQYCFQLGGAICSACSGR